MKTSKSGLFFLFWHSTENLRARVPDESFLTVLNDANAPFMFWNETEGKAEVLKSAYLLVTCIWKTVLKDWKWKKKKENQKENSEVLRPNRQLKDGSQLIQTAQTGLHRSPFSLNTDFHTSTNSSRAGFVWNSSTLWIQTQTDEQEMQSRSTAEDISHHRPRDQTCLI